MSDQAPVKAPRRVLVVSSTFPQYRDDPRGRFIVGYWQERAQQDNLAVHYAAPRTQWCDGSFDQGSQLQAPVHRFAYAPLALSSLTGHFGLLENLRERTWRALLLPVFFAAQQLAVGRLLHEIKPERLAVHMVLPGGVPLGWMARARGVPYEIFAHGTDLDLALHCPWPIRAWVKTVLLDAQRVYFPSRNKIDRTLERLSIKATPHHWCVQTMRSAAQTPLYCQEIPVERNGGILYVGRLIAQKGVDVLLHALALLQRRVPLDVAGDGPERIALQRLATRLGVEARFHGFVDVQAREQLYARARLVCVPSRKWGTLDEGAPLVVVEAQERKIPLVASAIGGIPELCSNVAGCTLVKPNDPRALARVLLDVLQRA